MRHPCSGRFTRGFLVVPPGLTIRDRLRVLHPNDPDSWSRSRAAAARTPRKATLDTYWVPGINRSGACGGWAFAEFTDVYTMAEEFASDRSADRIRERIVTRDEVLTLLRAHKATIVSRFGVAELGLFGSYARDHADDSSDVDILVRFEGAATSTRYFGVQFFIEDLLQRPVDLVTHKALRKEIRPYVTRELVNV